MIEANVEIYIDRLAVLKNMVVLERTVLKDFVKTRETLEDGANPMTTAQKGDVLGDLTAARTARVAEATAVDEAFNATTPL